MPGGQSDDPSGGSAGDLEDQQKAVCRRYGAAFLAVEPDLKVGIARNVRDGLMPVNGVRHAPAGDTTGWYIWAGEVFSEDPDFFVPLHVAHLPEWCPVVFKYLALPPGWRFLVAPDHEDIWYDESLLNA